MVHIRVTHQHLRCVARRLLLGDTSILMAFRFLLIRVVK